VDSATDRSACIATKVGSYVGLPSPVDSATDRSA
jgi:hypothetical protein